MDLPAGTRRLLAVAAADPSGDPLLVWRAAGRLGIAVAAGAPAAGAGLVEFGAQVRFRHPLMRSAAYRSASLREIQEVHAALAEATDPAADPDRRAWHRAQAARVRMRTSLWSWSVPPGERRAAGGWLRRARSWNGRRC